MSKTKDQVKSEKEALLKNIETTLQSSFINLKETIGEKKFNRRVKKASKLLAAGAAKKMAKENKPKEEAVPA
ncbi:MAG: hypothetical protein QM731_29050 [Chitinophagaceae bacterium]